MPAVATIKLVLPDEGLADIDRVRGVISRESWIRDLCAAAVAARDALDGPCFLRIKATPREGTMEEGVRMLPALDD